MCVKYITKFHEALENTKFFKENGTIEFNSYDAGIDAIIAIITEIKNNKKQLFFIGNGGSSAIASHMTADFMKNGGMKTYSLFDNAVTTCMSNDYGYEYVFSKPLSFLAGTGDLLVAISSSGNSPNIVNAINTMNSKGGKVITLSGFKSDNIIKSMGSYSVYVPIEHYGIVESIHNLILQQIVDMILERDGVLL